MSFISFIVFFINISFITLKIEKNINKTNFGNLRILEEDSDSDIISINKTINLGEKGYTNIINTIDENGQLFLESYKDSSKEKYIYSLDNKGRQLFEDSSFKKYTFDKTLTNYIGNLMAMNYNGHNYLFNFFYKGNIEILDLLSGNLDNSINLEDKLSLSGLINNSYVNSLFKLKNDNNFIFSFYSSIGKVQLFQNTISYKITILKCSITVNSGNYDLEIIKKKTIDLSYFSSSISCFETTSYINCFYLNNEGLLTISIFDKDLNLIKDFNLKNTLSNESNDFRKGIFLKNETCAYIFFLKSYPKLFISTLYKNNNEYILNNFHKEDKYLSMESEALNSNCDMNDLIKIHDNRFAFISTNKNNKKLVLFLIDLFNNDESVILRKYIIEPEGYNINSNLRLFLFRNFIGFSYRTNEYCSFRILNYANSTDYKKIDDFLMKLEIYRSLDLSSNIQIENNIFDYKFIGIKIISMPDKIDTGLSIIEDFNQTEVKYNDIILQNVSIIFSYIGNKTIKEGNYLIEFAPIVSEKSYEEFNSRSTRYSGGEKVSQKSFFKSLEYIGRYGKFIFNLQEHTDFKCHGNCYSCYKGVVSDNEQYCVKCISNYYFIENTENCFKDPIGYYFNEEKNVYSSCHSSCAYCISKEINNTFMNCISCKNENYKYYPKNKNCLSCPKYVNYEQTNCIDEIPDKFFLYDSLNGIIEKCHELCSKCTIGPTTKSMNCDYCIDGYYLRVDNSDTKNCYPNNQIIPKNYFQKNIEKNIYYKCYDLCATCDDFGDTINMNCLSCIQEQQYEYDEKNKFCFIDIFCNYSYYYYTFDENQKKTKICLQQGEFCPEILPYEIIATKECILTCSYQDLINLICKPSNIKVDIEQMKQTFQNEIETNNEIIEDVLSNKFQDVTVIGYNSTYQITTTSNQEDKINYKNDEAISNINLGECEKIIKRENNISDNTSLIILKDDLKRNETISTQVEYEVYDPNTRKKLDLNSCKDTTIIINVPLDVNDETLNLYKNAKEQGYDIFDSESEFYHDVCTVYTTENGTDMILSDRRTDILNNTPSLCEDGCKYNGLDIITKKVTCECPPKYFINSNMTDVLFSWKFYEDIFFKFDRLNYKILWCYSLLKDKKNIIINYGFYIMSIILACFVTLIPINLVNSSNKLKLKCYKLIQDIKTIQSKYMNKNIKIKINNKKNSNDEPRTILINRSLKKSKTTLKNVKRRFSQISRKNDKKLTAFIKKNGNKSLISDKENNLRKSSLNLGNLILKRAVAHKKKSLRNNNRTNSLIKDGKLNKNSTKRSIDTLKEDKNPSLFKKSFDDSKKALNLKRNSIKRKTNNKQVEKQKERKIEEENLYIENYLKLLPKEERQKFFDEEELNKMEYIYALEIDKRDFIQYYFSLLKQKQLILFTFFNSKDYNIYLVKISLFICSFSLYFMINTFFFNDDNMHKIYKDNGKYDFLYQIPQIIYSTLISSVISIILKNLSLSHKKVLEIKKLYHIEKMIKQMFILIRNFKLKMYIFHIFGLILLSFGWYYITMFCAVYCNTQIHLLKDTFSSFGLSLLYPFGLSLLPGFFRIPSLKAVNKNKMCLYKISQLISMI